MIAAGVALAVVIVLLLSNGDDNPKKPSASTTPSTTSTTPARPIAQVNLTQPGGGKAVGLAQVIAQGSKRAMGIAAQGLPKTDKTHYYAVWLYNTRSEVAFLGFAPQVTSKGRLTALAQSLPPNFTRFKDVIVSLQTVDLTKTNQTAPKTPATIYLRGPFSAPANG